MGNGSVTHRPVLDKNTDSRAFRDFYYLKEELTDFCRKNGLPVSGGKIELTDRIAHFLDTGEVLSAKKVKRKAASVSHIRISEDMKIETDFICSEQHRAFFKAHIGNSFSFSVAFQKWLKDNSGKTYKDAIAAYYQILEDKKKVKTKIDKQFEYNTYIRDFFADNQGKSLEDAVRCWNYKKQLQGHNRYERSDLAAIKKKGSGSSGTKVNCSR